MIEDRFCGELPELPPNGRSASSRSFSTRNMREPHTLSFMVVSTFKHTAAHPLLVLRIDNQNER